MKGYWAITDKDIERLENDASEVGIALQSITKKELELIWNARTREPRRKKGTTSRVDR